MKPFDFNAGGRANDRGSAGGGADARATVVLLHSSGASSRQWGALAGQLGARYDVRAIDLHGHGKRPAWHDRAPLTLADEAALVEPILREGHRVHLVGHSYGGAVALKVAALHPDAVASVAVYEPVLFRWLFDAAPGSDTARDVLRIADTMRKYLQRGDAYRAAAPFFNYWAGTGAWEATPMERRDAFAARMRSVLGHFQALFDDALSATDLLRIAAPLLFVSGGATVASTRRIADLLEAALPGATHAVLAEMDHMAPVTRPDAFNRRVLAFLDEVDQGAIAGGAKHGAWSRAA